MPVALASSTRFGSNTAAFTPMFGVRDVPRVPLSLVASQGFQRLDPQATLDLLDPLDVSSHLAMGHVSPAILMWLE